MLLDKQRKGLQDKCPSKNRGILQTGACSSEKHGGDIEGVLAMHEGFLVHALCSMAIISCNALCVQVQVLECVEDLLQQPALSCLLGTLHTVCPPAHVCPAALTD